MARFNLGGFKLAEEHNGGNDAFFTMSVIMHMLHDKAPKDYELRSLNFKIVTLDFEGDKTDGIPEVGLTVVDTRDLWQLPPGTCWSAVRRSYHMIASDLFDSHDRGFYTAKGISFQNLPRMNFAHGSSAGKAKLTVRRSVVRWDRQAEEYKKMTRTFRVSADSDLDYSSAQIKDWILLRGDLDSRCTTKAVEQGTSLLQEAITTNETEASSSAASINTSGSDDKLRSFEPSLEQDTSSSTSLAYASGVQEDSHSTQPIEQKLESLIINSDEEGISQKEESSNADDAREKADAEIRQNNEDPLTYWDLSALGPSQHGAFSYRDAILRHNYASQLGGVSHNVSASQRGGSSQRGGNSQRGNNSQHGGSQQRGDSQQQGGAPKRGRRRRYREGASQRES